MSCQFEVKPMPYLFCESCMLNGCYPWNKNPALLCNYLGGLYPAILVVDEEDIAHECSTFKLVTKKLWKTYLEDLKKEAKLNEKCRIKAIDGKVFSNHPLPTESISVYRGKPK